MATKIYTSVDGKARNVNRIYVGINGKARRVTTAYVGVNGKARLVYKIIYKLGKVKNTQSIAPISKGREYLASASVGNYALFAGGSNYDTKYNRYEYKIVDAYDSQFTHTLPDALCTVKHSLTGGNIGNYALIVGGTTGNNNKIRTSTVDVYDISLIRTEGTSLYAGMRDGMYASNKKYALFGGGSASNTSDGTIGTAYDNSLIAHKFTTYDIGGQGSSASVGKYALFVGGIRFDGRVCAYDETLTKKDIAYTTYHRCDSVGVMTNHYAIFGGNGYSEHGVDVYDENLTKLSAADLSYVNAVSCGASLKGFGIFMVGKYVQYYDDNLTTQLSENMNVERYNAKAAIAGDYIVVAGGSNGGISGGYPTSIDAYTVN